MVPNIDGHLLVNIYKFIFIFVQIISIFANCY